MLTYFLSFLGIFMLYGVYKFQHWFFMLFSAVCLYWAYRFYRISK